MRVLVCPDKFAGTLSAVDAADAIARGWRRVRPGDEIEQVPLSDGGPGFLDVLHTNLGGQLHPVPVTGPDGRPVTAAWLEHDSTAYIEAAQANGLALVDPQRNDPWSVTTYGVGELIAAAAELPVVVGLGGSATNDGGRGAVRALAGRHPQLTLATDVDSVLLGPTGATYGFARQKGASEQDLPGLERRMWQWAQQAPELAERPGAGAAGGLGFGLMLLGASRVSGIGLVAEVVGLARACARADVVLTGEGAVDWQSLHGKVLSGVLACRDDAVVLAGRVQVEGLRAYSLLDFAGQRAMLDAAAALADLSASVARTWG